MLQQVEALADGLVAHIAGVLGGGGRGGAAGYQRRGGLVEPLQLQTLLLQQRDRCRVITAQRRDGAHLPAGAQRSDEVTEVIKGQTES